MQAGDKNESAGKDMPETTPAIVSGAVLGELNRRLVNRGISRRGRRRMSKVCHLCHLRSLFGVIGIASGWSGHDV